MQINPVIEKELKIKMRGWKSPALITLYLGFLGLVILLFFLSNREAAKYSMDYFNPRVSIDSYNTLALIQFLLILFITPALTAGAISGERERQTLDLLLCTNFPTLSVIIGKVFVSIAHILLLITASLPIMGTVFLYGGIRITDFLLLFALYISTALFLGSIGIFYSTIFRKTSVSIIVTYITVLFLMFGTIIIFFVWGYLIMHWQNAPTLNQSIAFMFANPLFAFASLIDQGNIGRGFMGLFDVFRTGSYAVPSGIAKIVIKPWVVNMAFNIIASVVFILVSAWKIKPIKGRSAKAIKKARKVKIYE